VINFRWSVIIYGVMAAWSRIETLKKIHFWGCAEKRPLAGKFSKLCSQRIHCDTDRSVVLKFREMWLTGSRWNRALLIWQKNLRLALQLSLLRGSRPKSARANHWVHWVESAPDFIQIGSLSVELYPNAWIPSIFGWSLASSRRNMWLTLMLIAH